MCDTVMQRAYCEQILTVFSISIFYVTIFSTTVFCNSNWNSYPIVITFAAIIKWLDFTSLAMYKASWLGLVVLWTILMDCPNYP